MADLWGDDDDQNEELNNEEDDEEMDDEEDILDTGIDRTEQVYYSLLMRFCPHDSSMLYPQVRVAQKA